MQVVVVIGAGGIGMAIARRQGFGKHILLADFNEKILETAAKELETASFRVSIQKADVSSRESVRELADHAASLGDVINVVNTAGLSPNMAPPDRILAVDLYGSAVVFEEFERVIAPGGAALIVSSMAGHMSAPLPPEQGRDLAFAPGRRTDKEAVPGNGGRARFDGGLHPLKTSQSSSSPGVGHHMGPARCACQLHQSRNYLDAACAARTEFSDR